MIVLRHYKGNKLSFFNSSFWLIVVIVKFGGKHVEGLLQAHYIIINKNNISTYVRCFTSHFLTISIWEWFGHKQPSDLGLELQKNKGNNLSNSFAYLSYKFDIKLIYNWFQIRFRLYIIWKCITSTHEL